MIGDPLRLLQVVENLLTNAVKYTNEGGQIVLTLESDKDKARISVRDSGTGISAEFLPHVFEVFAQAPQTLDRAQGGMGLGLPLVQRLVRMHEGEVTASSAGLGKGSEFVVIIPRVLVAGPIASLEGRPAATEPSGSRRHRILIVDDEKDLAEVVGELLDAEGHETLVVNDGPAALAAVRTFNPEVVLLDIGLPEMDGYEVGRRLREQQSDREILLIGLTGYRPDEARLKQAGFDRHLLKPIGVGELSAVLAAWDARVGDGTTSG